MRVKKWMKALGAVKPISSPWCDVLVIGDWCDGLYPILYHHTKKGGGDWWLLGVHQTDGLTRNEVVLAIKMLQLVKGVAK